MSSMNNVRDYYSLFSFCYLKFVLLIKLNEGDKIAVYFRGRLMSFDAESIDNLGILGF